MERKAIVYKWKKIFASINHNKGKIILSPEEAQELIDDIDSTSDLNLIEINEIKSKKLVMEKLMKKYRGLEKEVLKEWLNIIPDSDLQINNKNEVKLGNEGESLTYIHGFTGEYNDVIPLVVTAEKPLIVYEPCNEETLTINFSDLILDSQIELLILIENKQNEK